MPQPELRAEPRIAVSFRGTLTAGEKTTPCAIQNMCSRGFLIEYSKDLPARQVDQVLRLRCELYPAQFVECTVEVRHVNAVSLGARVIEMSDADKRLCQRYLDEQRAAGRGRP